MVDLIVFLGLLSIGYFFGSYAERRHYQSIKKRERQTLQLPLITYGAKQPLPDASNSVLLIGEVVIANDYFKLIAASLRNLVGGRMVVYESLLDRGRREAMLRMKEQAIEWGATEILNVRLETSCLSGQNSRGPVSIEVIAYGTAIR